jgi:high-affinity iron transporter
MAIVFAGRGVAELQSATVLPLTPVAWAPRIEALGIFPTRETLLAQGVFVLLLLYAIAVTIVRRRTRGGDVSDATPSAPRKVARG